MAIVIKRRITLESLGEEYADSYLVFRAVSLDDFDELAPEIKANEKDEEKSRHFIRRVLEDRFIEGKFDGEAVTKDQVKDFDLGTLVLCFRTITTRPVDPKVETQ